MKQRKKLQRLNERHLFAVKKDAIKAGVLTKLNLCDTLMPEGTTKYTWLPGNFYEPK